MCIIHDLIVTNHFTKNSYTYIHACTHHPFPSFFMVLTKRTDAFCCCVAYHFHIKQKFVQLSLFIMSLFSSFSSSLSSFRITVNPNSNCDVCKYCTRGDPHFCKVGGIRSTVGIWKNGGWARYCKVCSCCFANSSFALQVLQ